MLAYFRGRGQGGQATTLYRYVLNCHSVDIDINDNDDDSNDDYGKEADECYVEVEFVEDDEVYDVVYLREFYYYDSDFSCPMAK